MYTGELTFSEKNALFSIFCSHVKLTGGKRSSHAGPRAVCVVQRYTAPWVAHQRCWVAVHTQQISCHVP